MSELWYKSSVLIESPIDYALFIDEDSFRACLKDMEYENWQNEPFLPRSTADACVHTFFSDSGREINLVCVNYEKAKTMQPSQVYGLLIHEAVHIWQHIRESLGEKNPSCEFEAYSIQRICQNLFHLYDELTREKNEKDGDAVAQ